VGFSHAWTFDSHILWEEPYVIFAQMLAATERITVGPFVTNPATRDPSVTASLFATLNEGFGNRTICGIGRGDSARRVLGRKPTTLAKAPTAASGDSAQDVHKVGRGESLRSIARQYGISVGLLKSANGMLSDTVRAGAMLTIPTG